MKAFLFIIQFDSFSKTLIPVIKYLLDNDYPCDIVLLKQKFYKKAWISKEILSLFDNIKDDLGIFGLYSKRKTLQIIKKNNYSVITIGTTYTSLIERVHYESKKNKLKSKIVSGYVGALLKNNNDGFVKGVKRRSFSDLIWVPGKEAKQQILSLNLINTSKTKIVNTGLPRFDNLFEKLESIRKADKNKIIFFEQPTFPVTKSERILLVRKLIDLAKVYKENIILIKPRFNEKIGHAHRPKYLLQDIFKNISNKPKNIKISNDNIYSLFKECKLALTISSTAGLESLVCKIPTFFINDFCNNQNLYGSDDFKKFNALISFDDLYNKNLPQINFNPIFNTIRCDGNNTLRLSNELIAINKQNN